MERVVVVVILVVLLHNWNTANGDDVDKRKVMEMVTFPWQGSYRRPSGSHVCGCVFVGGTVVLTAAHCGGSPSYTMEFGATVQGTGSIFKVATVTIHPLYGLGPDFAPNDLSVLQSPTPLHGSGISPARLAPTEETPGGVRVPLSRWRVGVEGDVPHGLMDTPGIFSRWGGGFERSTNPGVEGVLQGQIHTPGDLYRWGGGSGMSTRSGVEGVPHGLLQPTGIPVISDEECGERWGDSFQSDSMLCVYDGHNGACHGDSGGPLTVGSTLYGLSSWGASGCNASLPSVYTRVGAYRTWVCRLTQGQPVGC